LTKIYVKYVLSFYAKPCIVAQRLAFSRPNILVIINRVTYKGGAKQQVIGTENLPFLIIIKYIKIWIKNFNNFKGLRVPDYAFLRVACQQ